MNRALNFNPGPAQLPEEVLLKAQKEFLNWNGLSSSILEVSHRGQDFIDLAAKSIENIRMLYNIPHNYQVLFAQGGARGQFAAVPLNLLQENETALYLNSGYWSDSAAQEAKKYGNIDVVDVYSNVDGILTVTNLDFSNQSKDYKYVYFCSNETITGLEIFEAPVAKDSIVVADMSSDILSRKIDISKYGIIYAGAQKNIGAAGITLIIVRDDLIGQAQAITPAIWDYQILKNTDSMYNTPPTFAWYICNLVFEWLLSNGGISSIESTNKTKAETLYAYIDNSNFYKNPISVPNRSRMNVTFSTGSEDLDTIFHTTATARQIYGLKGHPVFGGLRASIYNSVTIKQVNFLIDYMEAFKKEHHK